MKLTIVIQPKWIGRFSMLICLLFMLTSVYGKGNDGETLVFEKVYEQEIEVPEGTTIRTRGTSSPNVVMTGTMTSTTEKGAYTLKGKGGELVMKLDQRFNIYTWEKNAVKLKVVVTLEADDKKMEQEILSALTMNLHLSPDNSLEVDCFLGIQKITMRNSWFRGNDCTLIMKNGKEVKFRSITIGATLTIPETANLDLKAKYIDVNMGRTTGQVNLDLNGAYFTAEYVADLQGTLRSSVLDVKEVKTASISAHSSKVNILSGDDIEIGKLHLDNGNLFSHASYYASKKGNHILKAKDEDMGNIYSSTTIYALQKANQLQVYSSLNDKFSLNELGTLKIIDASFSDFEISKLLKKASGNFNYGELNISALDKDQFENITLTSSFGSIRIFGQEVENLKVDIKNITKKEKTTVWDSTYPENNFQVSSNYKMTSAGDQTSLFYQKGNDKEMKGQKGLIQLTCEFCDLILN